MLLVADHGGQDDGGSDRGFEVAITLVSDLIQEDEAVRLRLAAAAPAQIYHCRKA